MVARSEYSFMTHRALGLLAALLVTAGCSATSAGGTVPSRSSLPASHQARKALSGLRVSGNRLVDGNDTVVHLHGINRSGTEYACVQGWGIFDGPDARSSLRR